MDVRTVADLRVGQQGRISGFADDDMSLKLLEMGCLPGSEVRLCQKAPLGCPVCICVSGYTLSLRKREAATILLDG